MRFVGGVKQCARKAFLKLIENDKKESFLNLTSGKFTLENSLILSGATNVSGNDVSLISCAIGNWLVGKKLDFTFKNELEFLNDFSGDESLRISALLFGLDFCENPNNRAMASLRDKIRKKNAEIFIKETGKKFLSQFGNLKGKIFEFYGVDLFQICSGRSEIVFCYLPFDSGGYEKMYKNLENNVIWQRPAYTKINGDLCELASKRILTENERAIVITDKKIDEIKRYLAYEVREGGRATYFYKNYDNSKKKFFFLEDKFYKLKDIIKKNEVDELCENSKLEILQGKSNILNLIDSDSLAGTTISKSNDGLFVFKVDGRIIGFFSIKIYIQGKDLKINILQDYCFLNYRKLSKLIVMLICSNEVKEIISKKLPKKDDIENALITTAVKTKAPVSMKYRGVAKYLHRKEKTINGIRESYLIYTLRFTGETLQERFKLWLRKYWKEKE